MKQTKQQKRFVLLLLLLVLLAVGLLGRLEFHNELEREVLPGAFLGYVGEDDYTGTLTVDESWLPQQFRFLGSAEQQTLSFTQAGRVGIFADLVYYENRVEKRSWFSGKLLKQASEYYYKLDSPLRFQPVYETLTPVSLDEIRPSDYDYMAFQGW